MAKRKTENRDDNSDDNTLVPNAKRPKSSTPCIRIQEHKYDEETVEESAGNPKGRESNELIARIAAQIAIEDECEQLDRSLSQDEINVIDQVMNRCSQSSCSPLEPVFKHLEDLREQTPYEQYFNLSHLTDEEIARRCQELGRRHSESSKEYLQRLKKAAIQELYGQELFN